MLWHLKQQTKTSKFLYILCGFTARWALFSVNLVRELAVQAWQVSQHCLDARDQRVSRESETKGNESVNKSCHMAFVVGERAKESRENVETWHVTSNWNYWKLCWLALAVLATNNKLSRWIFSALQRKYFTRWFFSAQLCEKYPHSRELFVEAANIVSGITGSALEEIGSNCCEVLREGW